MWRPLQDGQTPLLENGLGMLSARECGLAATKK
jgi:hypothetical protein